MEVHPFLENGCVPNEKIWYVVPTLGTRPFERVGSSMLFMKIDSDGYIYCIGGANPDETFASVHRFNLNSFTWESLSNDNLLARYEHSVFSSNHNNNIYVFGGANQTSNFNDIQMYDTNKDKWCNVDVQGEVPSPRTYHSSTAFDGDTFYVIFGGHHGHTAVDDDILHCFNLLSNIWTSHDIKGSGPKPRQGHVVAVITKKLYLHGGMADMHFLNDLYTIDLEDYLWGSTSAREDWPCPRAAHGSVVHLSNLYIYGGMNETGALNDFHMLNTSSREWTKIIPSCSPGNRLDFAICFFSYCPLDHEIVLNTDDSEPLNLEQSPPSDECDISKQFEMCAVLGGMDTEGIIFDDMLAIVLNNRD